MIESLISKETIDSLNKIIKQEEENYRKEGFVPLHEFDWSKVPEGTKINIELPKRNKND